MKALSADLRAECVRLRVEERLTMLAVSQRTGASYAWVKKVCAPHKLTADELRHHHRRGATVMRTKAVAEGRARSYKEWTAAEDETIGQLYPGSSRADVLAALPGRSWKAIQDRASIISVLRRRGAPIASPDRLDPIVASLVAARQRQRMSVRRLSKISRIGRETIRSWESGKFMPRMPFLREWAAALGLELCAVPKGRVIALGDWEGIQAPAKEQLMGRRAA